MSSWICCNSCFLTPSDQRPLTLTTCGHLICSMCFSKGNQGSCLICNARCQVSLLSDKSSSEVKTLFSDVSVVAAKHCKEISKVLMFQAGHKSRLCTYYQQKSEKQKDAFAQMKQEMQHLSKKLNEQSAYIAKLENSLQHHNAKSSSLALVTHSSHIPHGHKSVLQIPKSSPLSISRHSSMSNLSKSMEVSERSLFRKPSGLPRAPLFGASQPGQMSSVSLRLSSQEAHHTGLASISSAFPSSAEAPYSQTSRWQSPIFNTPSSFRNSMSSLF